MSRPLIKEMDEEALRRIQASLIKPEEKTPAGGIMTLSKKDVSSIISLIALILEEKPVVIDAYITPNEAATLSGVSRPVIIEMLKNHALAGHKVGKHWRIKRESLIEYLRTRDTAMRTGQSIDESGFGIE